MQCPSCGVDVRAGQKFCMECGASLRGVSENTGEVPVIAGARQPAADDVTHVMAAAPAGRDEATMPPPSRPLHDEATMPVAAVTAPVAQARRRDAVPTSELTVVPATTTTVQLGDTGRMPAAEPGVHEQPRAARQGFRLRPMLFVALLGAAAAVVGTLTTLIQIEAGPQDLFDVGTWKVNDFGTNNTAAGLVAAGAMVFGAVAWCFGFRWGAGLAGGAGAALAGWVALIVGLAEWPIATAEGASAVVSSSISRDIGYWALVGAGGIGVLVLLLSLARSGRNRRSGLDPWIAALGAVSFLLAAGGPLIPAGTADWSGNYSSESLGVDLPTLFFVGRGVQLGLLALVGVVGFLLVRRYGLGLAVGAATACGWLLVTAATEQTTDPIGPGFANPGALDLRPHAVTIVGMAMVGFFALVAIAMALLDSDR